MIAQMCEEKLRLVQGVLTLAAETRENDGGCR